MVNNKNAGKKKGPKKEKSKHGVELAEVKRIEQEKLKQQQLEDELERQRLAIEQAEERRKMEIVENDLRRDQLHESGLYFEDFNAEIRGILCASKKHQDWQRYMRCNGLPNVNQPGDLRKYIHMWRESEVQKNRAERNWLLQTNEVSILTQNREVPNLTVANVRAQQKNIGIVYAERIREVLHILEELELTIQEPGVLSNFILEDLITIRTELRVNLGSYIDQLAFKILSNIDRDMTLDSSSMATYTFESDILFTQIYTVRDIPQPQLTAKEKLKEETKHLEMEFNLLKLHVNLPPTIKLCKSALRALWLNFDHFSDYCRSYNMPKLPAHCSYPDSLAECCADEWRKREEIKEIATANLVQESSGNPALDPATTYIDVDKIYGEFEEAQMALRKRLKGPEMLKLRPTEINLRSHRIVGGIYGIDYLEQPKQNVKIGKVYLTTIQQNKLSKKVFYQSYKPPSPPQPGVRRLPEEIEAEIKQMEQNLDKLVLVNVQLPDTVLWFEPPLVCRWEHPDETQMHFEEDQLAGHGAAGAAGGGASNGEVGAATECTCPGKSGKRSNRTQIKRIPDFNLLNIPANIDMYEVMANYIMPRLPDGYRIKTDSLNVQQQRRRNSLMKYASPELKRRPEKRDSNVVTDLLEPTNSPRNLFPIMSYKRAFQVEIRDPGPLLPDDMEDVARRGRSKLGNVVEGEELETVEDGVGEKDSTSHCDEAVSEDETAVGEGGGAGGGGGDCPKKPQGGRRGDVYLLSSFLKDLDKLKLSQYPKFQRTLNDSLMRNNPERGGDPEVWANALKIIEGDARESRTSLLAADESKCKYCEEKELAGNGVANMGHWSNRDIHDVKFNEDKLTIQFRTGRLGFFGFAANRYSNLPFQTWELKPDTKNLNLITFTLTAAVVSVDISISDEGVRLNTIQGCNPAPFQKIINQFMEFKELKGVLKGSSVDLFPEEGSDATIYTEGSCEKHNVMERHLYECMASVAMSHNFSWSRWNLLTGSRIAVILMREFVENRKPLNHSTLYVTPLRTTVIDCTEVSASFNTTPAARMEYYADLHQLVLKHGHPSSLKKREEMSLSLRKNVAQILKSTRPLSFC